MTQFTQTQTFEPYACHVCGAQVTSRKQSYRHGIGSGCQFDNPRGSRPSTLVRRESRDGLAVYDLKVARAAR